MQEVIEDKSNRAIRILHVVECLDEQAVETWLLRIFKAASVKYPQFRWTFFCILSRAGKFDDAVRAAGGEVIHTRHEIGNKLAFVSDLRQVMKVGRYDILHCHHDIMSALYLVAALGLPFRQRIVHFHNTATHLLTPSPLKRALLYRPMQEICLRWADKLVGISREALTSIIGTRKPRPGRDSVVHYGIDTSAFAGPQVDPLAFRREFGLDTRAKILLFVGRMVEYKNPCFVIEMLERMVSVDPNVVAVFAGSGEHETAVRQLAEQKSLAGSVRVLGFRQDAPNLMRGADLLVWPGQEEPKEGLGLGIVEAQAAGLPVLMSRSVPVEAVVVPQLVDILPLAAGPQAWADAALAILNRPRPSRQESLAKIEASSFSLTAGVANIMSLYQPESAQKNHQGVLPSLSGAFEK